MIVSVMVITLIAVVMIIPMSTLLIIIHLLLLMITMLLMIMMLLMMLLLSMLLLMMLLFGPWAPWRPLSAGEVGSPTPLRHGARYEPPAAGVQVSPLLPHRGAPRATESGAAGHTAQGPQLGDIEAQRWCDGAARRHDGRAAPGATGSAPVCGGHVPRRAPPFCAGATRGAAEPGQELLPERRRAVPGQHPRAPSGTRRVSDGYSPGGVLTW
uniref:Uncharacterized protein LOC116945093 n=1 Tax=Petromyzon marinus TaxID=7757 RepID=A0AAJ7WYQ1_PETMA|nr:uncharacterized protein LOC116945093 [Petromyzon marinus]